MKTNLPIKLGIFVVVIFSLLTIGMALWRPVKIRYYASKLKSENKETRQNAAIELFRIDAENVIADFYSNLYTSKDESERENVIRELCDTGKQGEKLMMEILNDRCKQECVKIPAYTMSRKNGNKIHYTKLIRESKVEGIHIRLEVDNFIADKDEADYINITAKITNIGKTVRRKNGKYKRIDWPWNKWDKYYFVVFREKLEVDRLNRSFITLSSTSIIDPYSASGKKQAEDLLRSIEEADYSHMPGEMYEVGRSYYPYLESKLQQGKYLIKLYIVDLNKYSEPVEVEIRPCTE